MEARSGNNSSTAVDMISQGKPSMVAAANAGSNSPTLAKEMWPSVVVLSKSCTTETAMQLRHALT